MRTINDNHTAREKGLLLSLAVALAILLPSLLFGNVKGHLFFYPVQTIMVVPAFLFVGFSFSSDGCLMGKARRLLVLGLAVTGWFFLTQFFWFFRNGITMNLSQYCAPYLLALPFAAISDKTSRECGLGLVMYFFIFSCLVYTAYALILIFDILPLTKWVPWAFRWYGTRIYVLWHPNVVAAILLTGMGGILYCLLSGKIKAWLRCFLVLFLIAFYVFLSLTNCRTVILLAGALLAYVLFLVLERRKFIKNPILRIAVSAALCAVLILAFYKVSEEIYKANTARIQNIYAGSASTENFEDPDDDLLDLDTSVEESKPVKAPSSGNRSILAHLGTFNGRTTIWRDVFRTLKADKTILLFGSSSPVDAVMAANPQRNNYHHAHNSWMEMLMWQGIPGLLFSLYFSLRCLFLCLKIMLDFRSRFTDGVKVLAALAGCLLIASTMEAMLFTSRNEFHCLNFLFFFLLGYMEYICVPNE